MAEESKLLVEINNFIWSPPDGEDDDQVTAIKTQYADQNLTTLPYSYFELKCSQYLINLT
jgi:hypothetical protein